MRADREEIRRGLQEILKVVTEGAEKQLQVNEAALLREDVGLDSLQMVEMLYEFEERFGIRI